MELFKIIIAGILSTTFMTVFSHILGKITGHCFNEAQLLNKILKKSHYFNADMGKNNFWGWFLHYIIGIVFAFALYIMYYRTGIDWNIPMWSLLGLGLGTIGATGWYIMYYFHPDAPKVNFKAFTFQLLIAHVIFSMVALMAFTIFTT